MSYCSLKRWGKFSPSVQELRIKLSKWLEDLLMKEVTAYKGSDSVIYEPNNWSKYKLVPYDMQSMPPLSDLDEGILICIDCDAIRRFLGNTPLEQRFPHIPWHSQELEYKVGRSRTYRVVPFPAKRSSENRKKLLNDLADVIQDLEPL